MKSKWLEQKEVYDGTQLRCQYAYFQHSLLGDSVVAWRGPCQIPFKNMLDGEDFLAQSPICGSDMLHFVIEIFNQPLREGVFLQRLFAALVKETLETQLADLQLLRDGDDLYCQNRKLSISIAAKSPLSTMIHFAVNVSREGTPVPTCALMDWNVDPKNFAEQVMSRFVTEYASILDATVKVRPINEIFKV